VTNEENIKLVAEYRTALVRGDTAGARRVAEQILKSNEGLVQRLASRWGRPACDEDRADALQAARMGILRAIQDFNPELGAFSTHANNHVRDYVQRWTGKTTAVSRPRSATMPASIAREASKFRMRTGREPTAQELGITDAQMTEWSTGTHFVALDDWDDDTPRTELTYDEDEAEHARMRMRVETAWEEALAKLSPRNREITERVFLKGERMIDVAAAYGFSHGRIVQICKRIENRLRRAVDPSTDTEDYEETAHQRAKQWRDVKRAQGWKDPTRYERVRRFREAQRAKKQASCVTKSALVRSVA